MVVHADTKRSGEDAGAEEPFADRLTDAFSRRFSLDAAALFLQGLDTGLGWELATHAVAEGTSRRFGSSDAPVSSVRTPQHATNVCAGLAVGLALYIAFKPALSLTHEVTLAGFALALNRFAASGVWQPLVSALGIDPIYTDGAFRSLGAVQVQGLSVADPVGSLLHSVWPTVFLAPDLVRAGAAVSLVAAPGAHLLARAASALCADFVCLSLASLLMRRTPERVWLTAFALLVQAEIVVGHVLDGQVGAAELDASGLSFALALLFPDVGWQLTTELAHLPAPVQSAMVGLAFVALAYAGAVGVLLVAGVARRAGQRTQHARRRAARVSGRVAWAATALSLAIVWSPLGGPARAAANWQPVVQAEPDHAAAPQTIVPLITTPAGQLW